MNIKIEFHNQSSIVDSVKVLVEQRRADQVFSRHVAMVDGSEKPNSDFQQWVRNLLVQTLFLCLDQAVDNEIETCMATISEDMSEAHQLISEKLGESEDEQNPNLIKIINYAEIVTDFAECNTVLMVCSMESSALDTSAEDAKSALALLTSGKGFSGLSKVMKKASRY